MIVEGVDPNGKKKFFIQKSHHPKTGNHHPKAFTEFSAAGWNDATMDYLDSVKGLDKKRLQMIFKEAKSRVKGRL